MQPVKIVVDSTADIPPEWIAELDIGMIPAFVNFGEESYPDDGVALTRTQFYERLKTVTELPRTSAPPLGLAEQVISDQLAKAERVIAFTLATQFSSLHNAIRVAGQHIDPDRVTVIDTGTVSLAEGWQAIAAAEAAAAGSSYAGVIAVAQQAASHSRLIAVLDTLDYLRIGGRVSWFVSNLSSLLQLKPLLEVKGAGEVVSIGRVRTMSKALQLLIETARADAPFARLAIVHSNDRPTAEKIQDALRDLIPTAPHSFLIGDVATAIGTHVGPGAAGIIYVRK